jgi:hypothetical protein
MEVQGKIFVVVTVLAVIMAGLYLYLFFIDRKLRKLEHQMNDKKE